jgi:hypothetical protein
VGILGISFEGDPEVQACEHYPGARVRWIDFDAGKPPQFAFSGFPEGGQVTLSKNTIIVSCRRCSGPRVFSSPTGQRLR